MKLKQPAQERNKEFFLMVQTLFNQASLIVETNLFNYNPINALDDLNKCEKFRSKTARMNTEGQSCLLDLIDTDQNQLAGCCGFIRVNRIEKEAQLVVIFYEQYIDYIEESIAYILKVIRTSKYALNVLTCNVSGFCVTKDTLGILRRLNFYDATDELQRDGDDNPCYMRFVVDESARPTRRGDDQSSATGSVSEICRFWARGYCRFGEDCRYLHISAVPSGALALSGSPSLSSLGPPPSSPALSSLPGSGMVGTAGRSTVPAIFMPVSAVPGAAVPFGGVRSGLLPPFYPAAAYPPDSGGLESPQYAFPQYPYAPYAFPSYPYASYSWQQPMLSGGAAAGSAGIATDVESGVAVSSPGIAQQPPSMYVPSPMMYNYNAVQEQQGQMQVQSFQQQPQMQPQMQGQIQGQREDGAPAVAMMYTPPHMMPMLQQLQLQQVQQAQTQGQGQDQPTGVAQPSDYLFYTSASQYPYPYTAQVPQQPGADTAAGEEQFPQSSEAPLLQDTSFSSCSTAEYYEAAEPPAGNYPAGYPVGAYPAASYPFPQYQQQQQQDRGIPAGSYPSSIDGTEEHNLSQLSFSQSFSRSQDQQEQGQDAGPVLKPSASQDTSFDSGPRQGTADERSNGSGGNRGGSGNVDSSKTMHSQQALTDTTQARLPFSRARSDDQSSASTATKQIYAGKSMASASASGAPLLPAPPSTPTPVPVPSTLPTGTTTAAIAVMHQKLLDLVNTAPPTVLARLRYNEQHLLPSSGAEGVATGENGGSGGGDSAGQRACTQQNTSDVRARAMRSGKNTEGHHDNIEQDVEESAAASHYLTAQDLTSLNDYYQRMLNPSQYRNRFERIFTHGHFTRCADHRNGAGDATHSETAEATESSVTIHATQRLRRSEDDDNSTISCAASSSPFENYDSARGFEVHEADSEDFNFDFHPHQDLSPPDQPEGSWRERCEKGLSGRALGRHVQRRETARRNHRLRYLLRALQLHRPRGPLNSADIIDLISPFRDPATATTEQRAGWDDNAPVIDLTDLVALSMQEPHERRQQHAKKPGDTRSTALELDLSTPSLVGSRTSAVTSVRGREKATASNTAAANNGNEDGYESDEEEGDGNDEQSILTQPPAYTGERIGQRGGASEKNTTEGVAASHKDANNNPQSSRNAGRAFAIRQFSPTMVQCIVNGRAQRGPWPSLPNLLDAMGMSSAQGSVESLLFLNAGVVQAYCAERSDIAAQFHRMQVQQGQQLGSRGQLVDLQQREQQPVQQQPSSSQQQQPVPSGQVQMSASMQQLQQRLLAQQQLFFQQQQQQQSATGSAENPTISADQPYPPFPMPPGGMHPQQLQYWMQQQRQIYMHQFRLQQQHAQVTVGAEVSTEGGATALNVANTGGAYAQRQPPQQHAPPAPQAPRTEQQPQQTLAESSPASATSGPSFGPPERLRPPPIKITPHSASVPTPVYPPRPPYAPQPYPQYVPQQAGNQQQQQSMQPGQNQKLGAAATPPPAHTEPLFASMQENGGFHGKAQQEQYLQSQGLYNIRSALAQQQERQHPQQVPGQESLAANAATGRPPPIYPRTANPSTTTVFGPPQSAHQQSAAPQPGSSNKGDSSFEPGRTAQLQPPKKRKSRKSREQSAGGSGVSVSGGSSGQDSPSPFPRAQPTFYPTATTGAKPSPTPQQRQGQRQFQAQGGGGADGGGGGGQQSQRTIQSQGQPQKQQQQKQQSAAPPAPAARRPPAPV